VDVYVVVFILFGLVICLTSKRFGRAALGILAALNVDEKSRKKISWIFRLGAVVFGLFCIFIGTYALITGNRIIPA
jgi:hypothetical protein